MAGTSEREKALKNAYSQSQQPYRFDYPTISKELDKSTNFGVRTLRQTAAQQGAAAGQSAAASLQSRGIGGSVLNAAVQRAKNNANLNAGNNITQLLMRKLMMNPQIMQNFNQMDLQKLQLQGNLASQLSDDTWFDDVLAVLNTAGNVAGGFGNLLNRRSDNGVST